MTDHLPSATGEQVAPNRHSGPPKSGIRPYDNRPRSGPGHTARRTSPDRNAVRVVLPDKPPRLTPAAAQALLRILIKAHDRLSDTDNPRGAAK